MHYFGSQGNMSVAGYASASNCVTSAHNRYLHTEGMLVSFGLLSVCTMRPEDEERVSASETRCAL